MIDREQWPSFGVLAGGASSRMGASKASLPFHGRSFLETVLDAGRNFPERIVSLPPLDAPRADSPRPIPPNLDAPRGIDIRSLDSPDSHAPQTSRGIGDQRGDSPDKTIPRPPTFHNAEHATGSRAADSPEQTSRGIDNQRGVFPDETFPQSPTFHNAERAAGTRAADSPEQTSRGIDNQRGDSPDKTIPRPPTFHNAKRAAGTRAADSPEQTSRSIDDQRGDSPAETCPHPSPIPKSACVVGSQITDSSEQMPLPPGVSFVCDERRGAGPLEGMLHLLEASTRPACLIVATDMPFLTAGLAEFLASRYAGRGNLILTRGGCPEPLCGIYSRDCIAPIRDLLRDGPARPRLLFDRVPTEFLPIEETDFSPDLLRNINTPEDYRAVLQSSTKLP